MDIIMPMNEYDVTRIESSKENSRKSSKPLDVETIKQAVKLLSKRIAAKKGIYSVSAMHSAGFKYTGDEDKVCCDDCGLEVSNWTEDMKPFFVHAERQPTCSFVCSHAKITEEKVSGHTTLNELQSLKGVRERSFSQWPHRTSPSSTQMIQAGFFCCNVGDRVICLYCNIICQQWVPHSDDACDVHRALSPKCPYVITNLNSSPVTSIPIVNQTSTNTNVLNENAATCDQFVSAAACHTSYRELPKRYASFATWSNESTPSVDDLVRAGFFYTGTRSIVTCFYCNGSLQNWAATDNPMIEHARWFPHCAYAKQLCGEREYQKIQHANQRRKGKKIEHDKRNEYESVFLIELQEQTRLNKESQSGVVNGSGSRLIIQDESILSRYVAARLELPVSQSMMKRGFKISIVKRCWEDQLRLKGIETKTFLENSIRPFSIFLFR